LARLDTTPQDHRPPPTKSRTPANSWLATAVVSAAVDMSNLLGCDLISPTQCQIQCGACYLPRPPAPPDASRAALAPDHRGRPSRPRMPPFRFWLWSRLINGRNATARSSPWIAALEQQAGCRPVGKLAGPRLSVSDPAIGRGREPAQPKHGMDDGEFAPHGSDGMRLMR